MRTFSLILVLSAVALSVCGCNDDECRTCPTCSEPTCSNELYDGRLYVAMSFPSAGGSMGVYVVDTKTEQLVDSIIFGTSAEDVKVSSDGRYIATTDAEMGLRVWDASTFEMLTSMQLRRSPQFVCDDRYLLCHRLETTWLYLLPSFTLIHEDSIRGGPDVRYCATRNSFFSVPHNDFFYEYSLDSLKVVRECWPHDRDGLPYSLHRFDLNPEATLLYMLVVGARGSAFITYDLQGDSLIHEHLLYGYLGRVQANPVGGEVYVTDPGVLAGFTPGTIYVFDGQTGEYLEGISLYGYLDEVEQTWQAMSAWYMDIAPDGSQLYVQTGHLSRDPGTVLRVDTRTRQIESIIFPNIDRYPRELAVGPKP